jgi:transposase-like protein
MGVDSMKAEDFSTWLSAIAGLSAEQRREALQALMGADGGEANSALGDLAEALRGKAGKPGRREDALGTTGLERVESHGCPHCAGREIVGWGRSHGLLRFRCKSCGRTFNALTKTPMAHLRKKDRWLDHARAMIEGKSLAKTAELCGVHPTTAFRWRHRFLRSPAADKPRTLSGIVEADETFILESFKGRWSDLRRKARKRGGSARHPGLYQDNVPILVARDRKGATFDAVLPQVDSASIGAALAGVVTPDNHLVGDGGRSIAAFARRAGIPFHAVPSPGKPRPEAPHLHINGVNAYHGRLKQWLARFNGVATKNLPSYLGWRRALEAWGDQLAPTNWIRGAIGNGPYQQSTL